MSLDALHGDIMSPQALNRYAYVLGNPIMGVDPSGKKAKSLATAIIGSLISLATYELIRDADKKNNYERSGAALGGAASALFASHSSRFIPSVGKKILGFTIKKGTRKLLNAAVVGCGSAFVASSTEKLISIGLNPASDYSSGDTGEIGQNIAVGCLIGPLMTRTKMGSLKVAKQKTYTDSVKSVVGSYASSVLNYFVNNSKKHLSESRWYIRAKKIAWVSDSVIKTPIYLWNKYKRERHDVYRKNK